MFEKYTLHESPQPISLSNIDQLLNRVMGKWYLSRAGQEDDPYFELMLLNCIMLRYNELMLLNCIMLRYKRISTEHQIHPFPD